MALILESYGRGQYGIRSTHFSKALRQIGRLVPGMDFVEGSWRGYADAVLIAKRLLEAKGLRLNIAANLPDPKTVPLTGALIAYKGLRDYQKTGAGFLVTHAEEGCLLADDMGIGKAQPVLEPVLTPNGWRPIGELVVGDKVIGSAGVPVTITGVFPQGRRQVFDIELTDGSKTRSCREHLWTVQTVRDRTTGRTRTMRLEELVAAGLRSPLSGKGEYPAENHKFFVPMLAQPVEYTPQGPLPVDPYVVGALVANGHVSTSIRYFGSREQAKLVSDSLPQGYLLRPAKELGNWTLVCFSGRPGEENTLARVIRSLRLSAESKSAVGVKKSHTKNIPPMYMTADRWSRLQLLRGLMDNDGTVTPTGSTIEYNTTSPKLAGQVAELVRSLGWVASTSTRTPYYTHKGKRRAGRTDYRIRIAPALGGESAFWLEAKRKKAALRKKYGPSHAITSVKPAGMAECVCIEVDAPDQLYVTRDFILTHNTAQALRAARALKKPTLVVCPSFARGIWGDNPSSQVKDWWPEAWPPRVLTGIQPEKSGLLKIYNSHYLPEALLTVAHYDILHAWAPYLAGSIDTLVLDEVRFIQSEKSQRSKAARLIAEQARYRFGLDGTPVANHVSQLWNVIDTLCPGRMGKPFSFYLRYAGAHQEAVTPTKTVWKFDGLSNEEELHDRLQYFLLRRTMADVKMQLPPRQRQVLEFDVETKFAMGADVALRSDVNLRRALDLASDGKLPQVIETICAHLRGGRTVVVFTHRVAVCEAITLAARAEGFRAEFIHGAVSHKERIRRYESKPALLVANMDCVAGGIDLSYADTSFFAELDYDPQKVIQCSRRVYRFKQQRPVLEQFAIGRGTVDELIRDRMIKKLDMFGSVVGKMDDKLREDLDKSSEEMGVADLRRFWESIKGE